MVCTDNEGIIGNNEDVVIGVLAEVVADIIVS